MTQPRRIAAITLVVFGTAATAAHAQTVSARLDSAMRVAERAGFSGVVRLERDGVTLLEKGYGSANREKHIPFTAETVVQIGSNTKDFTAVAILQLEESGRLSQRDALAKYFPAAPADKRIITIAQLMNHRAGFPAGIGGDVESVKRAAFIERAMKTPLLFAPGARESYSNTGFSVLAAIIEQVTGMPYDAYVERNILAPIGLRRTGFLLPGFKPDDLAHGYLAAGTDAGTMIAKPHDTDGPYWSLRGNGGMLSTVGGMHAFYMELFEGTKLMKAGTRALRFDPNEPIGSTHFATDPDSPTLDERIQRFSNLHETLGAITIERIERFDNGSVEVSLKSALQGDVQMRVMADQQMPFLIHGIQVRVGG